MQRLLAVLLLLPALVGLSIDLEIGHDHGLLAAAEGTADGKLCLRDHEQPARAAHDGLSPTALPHRHDCAACHHSKTGRAILAAATEAPSGLSTAAGPVLESLTEKSPALGHPAPRGPPIS